MTDDELLKCWKNGMRITDIAKKFGYTRLSSISERLNKLLGKERKDVVKLSKPKSKANKVGLVGIPYRLIKEAGLDFRKTIYCKRSAKKNKIILELSYKRKI